MGVLTAREMKARNDWVKKNLAILAVESSQGGTGSSTPAPDAPVLSIDTYPSTTSVVIDWTEPDGTPTSYNVYVDDVLFSNVATLTETVTGLTVGVDADIYVTAVNATGESDPSNTVTASTAVETYNASTAVGWFFESAPSVFAYEGENINWAFSRAMVRINNANKIEVRVGFGAGRLYTNGANEVNVAGGVNDNTWTTAYDGALLPTADFVVDGYPASNQFILPVNGSLRVTGPAPTVEVIPALAGYTHYKANASGFATDTANGSYQAINDLGFYGPKIAGGWPQLRFKATIPVGKNLYALVYYDNARAATYPTYKVGVWVDNVWNSAVTIPYFTGSTWNVEPTYGAEAVVRVAMLNLGAIGDGTEHEYRLVAGEVAIGDIYLPTGSLNTAALAAKSMVLSVGNSVAEGSHSPAPYNYATWSASPLGYSVLEAGWGGGNLMSYTDLSGYSATGYYTSKVVPNPGLCCLHNWGINEANASMPVADFKKAMTKFYNTSGVGDGFTYHILFCTPIYKSGETDNIDPAIFPYMEAMRDMIAGGLDGDGASIGAGVRARMTYAEACRALYGNAGPWIDPAPGSGDMITGDAYHPNEQGHQKIGNKLKTIMQGLGM